MLILRSKYVKGFSSGVTLPCTLVTRERPRAALLARHTTDAHCVQYEVTGAAQARINKAGLSVLRERGGDVSIGVLLVDVDAPEHGAEEAGALEEWRAWQRIALDGFPTPLATYDTRGGYRIVWRYPQPVSPEEHEQAVAPAVVELLGQYGIEADRACGDWTRLFRLPFVRRDGVDQDHPHTIGAALPRLPLHLLDLDKHRAQAQGSGAGSGAAIDLSAVAGVKGLPQLFEALGLVRTTTPARIDVVCPWDEHHSSGGHGSSTSLLGLDSGGWAFSCLHNHSGLPEAQRGPKRTADLRALWPQLWDQHCRGEVPQAVTERAQRRTMAEIRADLPTVLREAIAAGRGVVKAPTGAGKSEAMLREALDRAARGDVVVIAAPSCETRDELRRRCQAMPVEGGGALSPEVYSMRGREPSTCEAYDQIEPLFRAGGPDAVADFCGGCPFRMGCKFFAQFTRERYRQAGRVVFTTHAFAFLAKSPIDSTIDLLVVDEDPTSTIAGELTATASGIDRAMALGAVVMDDTTRGALARLMGGAGATSAALGELGPITAGPADRLPSEAAATPRDQLSGLPDWRLPLALAQASAGGWAGAYVHGQTLTLPAPLLRWPEAEATVLLDASAEEGLAGYLLPGAEWFDLGTPAEVEHVEVIRYDIPAGRGDVLRRPEYAYSIHRAYDGPRTVHITHKGLRDAPEALGRFDWITGAQGQIDHFGSARESATNKYSDAQTIVLDSWHIPKSAVMGRAERICQGCPDITPEEGQHLARRQQEWRSVDQWLGRLRSVNRTERLRVVLIDRRPHWSNVLPDEEIAGLTGARVYEHTGALVNRPGALLAYHGRRLLQEGAYWLDEDTRPERVTDEEGRGQLRQITPLRLLRQEYRGRFPEFAEDVGRAIGRPVSVCWVRMIKGHRSWRRWFVRLDSSPVFGELVQRAALVSGCDWLEYEDGRHAGPGNIYYRAAQDAQWHLSEGEHLTAEGIAWEAERSTRQVERVLSALGVSAQELRQRGPDVFRPSTPPDALCSDTSGQAVTHSPEEYRPIEGWARTTLARGPPV